MIVGLQELAFQGRMGLELLQLLLAGQSLQEGVLTLQLGVFLHQLWDLLLQDLCLLSHSIQQVILDQACSILLSKATTLVPEV